MKIALCGPFDTREFGRLTGIDLGGAPVGQGGMPVTTLAAGLLRNGHQVAVVTCDAAVIHPTTIFRGLFSVTYCPLRAGPRYPARIRIFDLFANEIHHLESAIRCFRPDVVHAHWTYEYAEAAVRSRYPHLVTMHDLGWEYLWQLRDAYRFARLVMKYRTMPRVRNLTVVSPYLARKAWQYGYFGHVWVVPNGVEMSAPVSPKKKDYSRPILVTVGNRQRIKNVYKSVEAFRFVQDEIPDVELHLFGPGLDEISLGDAPGIIGHGDVPHHELMAFLADRATILVHPSRLETFGMIIAEAKSVSVPVVAGRNSGGVAFVCDDGVSILVDVEQAQEIAQGVLSLLTDKKHYERAAKESQSDVEQRFSSSIVTAQYEAIYREIIAG